MHEMVKTYKRIDVERIMIDGEIYVDEDLIPSLELPLHLKDITKLEKAIIKAIESKPHRCKPSEWSYSVKIEDGRLVINLKIEEISFWNSLRTELYNARP